MELMRAAGNADAEANSLKDWHLHATAVDEPLPTARSTVRQQTEGCERLRGIG